MLRITDNHTQQPSLSDSKTRDLVHINTSERHTHKQIRPKTNEKRLGIVSEKVQRKYTPV